MKKNETGETGANIDVWLRPVAFHMAEELAGDSPVEKYLEVLLASQWVERYGRELCNRCVARLNVRKLIEEDHAVMSAHRKRGRAR